MLEKDTLKALLAAIGLNDGANKGFWRIQPRDDEGQWIEMGADVLFRIRTGDGSLVVATVKGVYVGPSGKPGKARVMVTDPGDSGLEPGVHDIDSRNLQQFKAILPDEVLKQLPGGGRTDKFGKPVKTLEDSKLPTAEDLNKTVAPITPEDERLAKGELTDAEKEAEQDGRKESPVADLPAGFEAENPEKVKELLRESGVEPDDFDPDAKDQAPAAPATPAEPELKKATAAWMLNPANNGKQMFYVKNGKARPVWVDSFGETIYKGFAPADPDDHTSEGLGSVDEFVEALKNGNISGIYQGPVPVKDGEVMNGFEINRLAMEQASAKSKAKADAKAAKQTPAAPAPKKDPIAEIFADVAYNGDTDKTVDDLLAGDSTTAKPQRPAPAPAEAEGVKINAAQAANKPPLKPADASDIKPGDIIQLTPGGKPQDFRVVSNTSKTKLSGEVVHDIKVDANGRPSSIVPGGIPADAQIQRYDKPAAKAPATPATPATPAAPKAKGDAKAPAAPAAPATPAAPAAKKSKAAKPSAGTVTTKTGNKLPKDQAVKVALGKGRKDDGKRIPANNKSLDELRAKEVTPLFDKNGKPLLSGNKDAKGNLLPAEDPDAIINALLEENPQAKVGEDGAVIVERDIYTDPNGDQFEYEIAVQRTHDNKFMERYSFTNLKTGDKQSFYHYDYKDSFRGLYGEKNGLYVFRDQLLGRSVPGNPNSTENKKWFGKLTSLDRRIRFFRDKSSSSREFTDESLHNRNMKLLSEEELIRKYLTGRPRGLNPNGTVDKNFIQNFWEILDKDQSATNPQALETLVQLLGHLPDNEASRSVLIKGLRDGIKKHYNGSDKALPLATFATNIEKQIMAEDFDLRDLDRRPWASRNGRTILEKGDKIRYLNSEGEESIGEILNLNKRVAGYTDTVRVRFANGKVANVLAAKYMDRLTGTDDEDLDLTPYIPSPTGDAMRAARGVVVTPGKPKKPAQTVLDFGDAERRKDDNVAAGLDADDPADDANPQAADPYLGNSGVDADADADADATPAAKVGNVASLDTGDAFYSADGDYLGSVVEVIDVEALDGGDPGIAVYYIDSEGDEHYEIVEMGEDRGPK